MRTAIPIALLLLASSFASAAAASQEAAADGELVYRQNCARCHEGGVARLTPAETLRERSADEIYATLRFGLMQRQALTLSDAERSAVAEYLSGDTLSGPPIDQIPASAYCATGSAPADPLAGPSWNGWGADLANTRFQSAADAGLTAEEVPRLRLKWAFGFPGVNTAGSQATVVGGRIVIGSRAGLVYSLDAKSGCIDWIYEADGAVRTAIPVGPGPDGAPTAYFGDRTASIYAVDFITGELRWRTKIDDHLDATITGAPTLHDGRVFVGVASGEEGTAIIPTYECCTFRGSVAALDAATGELVWRRYTITEEPQPTGRNPAGAQTWGPSGAGVWSAPTVDPERGVVYVATGDSYSHPASPNSDALMALDLETGEPRWVSQTTPGDAWTVACMSPTEEGRANCPENAGDDVDYGSSTILTALNDGTPILLAGQKSGVMYGLDPDTGAILWETRISGGGILGGIEWGFAIDENDVVYASISDFFERPAGEAGGVTALTIAEGEEVWHAPPVQDTCGSREGCHTAQPGAVTAIPGVVFSTSLDGHLRAHATDTGRIIWDADTVGDYRTVNGVAASGGSLNGPGVTVVDGMLYVVSGYAGLGIPGNVLLAFSVDGE